MLPVMPSLSRIRRQQILRAAEGYLELEMPRQALESLSRLAEEEFSPIAWLLKGESLRALGECEAAIVPLRKAADEAPSDMHVWLALGWCYKRIGRLDMAIESLEEALEAAPNEAIIHYNLACYWSLAGNKRQAILFLGQALEIDPSYRDKISGETDFDAIRQDPQFRMIASVIV
jgi:tetratricopeptide (TPR) repeat protein